MSLKIEDISHLAELARVEVDDAQKRQLLNDLESVLTYVSEISDIADEDILVTPLHKNVLKDDIVLEQDDIYRSQALKNAPNTTREYIQVNQVL
jgi:aspartyl-tRNA(Asn)/glutamyl-tRNA(Gln) amidotransferase subunit C